MKNGLIIAGIVLTAVWLARNNRARCVFQIGLAWAADRLAIPERSLSYRSLSHRILRRMELALVVGASRRVKVPNEFMVHLGHHDWATLGEVSQFAATDLGEEFIERARRNGWTLPEHGCTVSFLLDEDLRAGNPVVTGHFSPSTPDSQRSEPTPDVASIHPAQPVVGPDADAETEPAVADTPSRTTRLPRYFLATRDADLAQSIELPIGQGRIELGRLHQPELHLPTVSATHCVLTVEGDSWTISDCGSRHGTLVNGDEVDERSLELGDVVQLGKSGPRFVFTCVDATQVVR